MADPALMIGLASTGLAAVAMTAAAALKGWQDWLELKKQELAGGERPQNGERNAELVELKTRLKKLEAIATGG